MYFLSNCFNSILNFLLRGTCRFKHVGNDKNSLRADAEHRLVDILLLGECDDLIVTCGSSYSRVAYSRADIVPLFVTYESHRWSLRHEPHQCLRVSV